MKLLPTLNAIKTLLEIAAILGASAWAYFKFIKGRLFKHKLDIEVSGTFCSIETGDHILANISIKNCGFTRVLFEAEYCVLRIFTPKDRPNRDFVDVAIWHRVATVTLLNDQKWIEPSEVIHEANLISLDRPGNVAVRLEASISDSHSLWRASTVIVNPHLTQANERKTNNV